MLKVPTGQSYWALEKNPNDARWCYGLLSQRENGSDWDQCHLNEFPQYRAGSLARVSEIDGGCALVNLPNAQGWVVLDLLEMTPAMRSEYEARKAAAAKREAGARARARKARTEAQLKEEQQEEKEASYIRTLPKLWSNSEQVMVATSVDCARDYQKVVQFARVNGTGIEFRKKLLELTSLGCAIWMPSGTAIEVIRKNDSFVEFRAYTGRKGTYGVALKENVR